VRPTPGNGTSDLAYGGQLELAAPGAPEAPGLPSRASLAALGRLGPQPGAPSGTWSLMPLSITPPFSGVHLWSLRPAGAAAQMLTDLFGPSP
jgi:hypothetical protein